MPIARRLAEFAYDLFHGGDLPADVFGKAVQVVIDQIGLQIGCARLPWSKAVYDYVESINGGGHSTVVAYGLKTSPELAAFANAAFGHGQDFDDTTMMVQTHAGAVVVPVALAIAEQTGASGEEFLRAVAAGLEVMLRAAHSVSPDCLRRGHHTPPAAGPFGAAIAAGLLAGHDADQLAEALSVAGSFSGGLTEYTQSGGSVKRIHTAIPTTSGIRAVALSGSGITGPVRVFEGLKGFCNVFANDPHPERLTEGLGREYLIREMGFKAYNCCYFIHAPLEAFLRLTREHDLSPEDIVRVDVGTSAHGVKHVGSIVHPTDEVGGQFSVAFTLALGLLREVPGISSYTKEQLADPELHAFADRVHVYRDDVATAEYPDNWGGIVTVTTASGATLEQRVRYQRGTPQNPMSEAELWEKFHRVVDAVTGPERGQQLEKAIAGLRQAASVMELVEATI